MKSEWILDESRILLEVSKVVPEGTFRCLKVPPKPLNFSDFG